MIKSISSHIITLGIGFIVGGAVTLFIWSDKPVKVDPKSATVETISGAPLTINSIIAKGKTTDISASYTGEGASIISVPNKSIPSANAWDNYRWGLGGMVSTNLTYSIIGSYRYQRFMGLGSVWYKNANGYEFGASAGAMFLF